MKNNEKFQKGLEALGIQLNEVQLQQFEDYYRILIEWNKVMNLTAITEYDEVITKHFLDSLSIVKLCDVSRETLKKNNIEISNSEMISTASDQGTENVHEMKKSENVNDFMGTENKKSQSACKLNKKRLLDLGTGAGFPGIPLKIAFPSLDIVLMDSLNKRINFLNEVIRQLSLKDIQAIHGRAEEFGRKEEFRERYDCCVSRAVAKLVSLSEYCLPFVKKGGYFIPYKSAKSEEEFMEAKYAIGQFGGKYVRQVSFLLPESDAERTLFLIQKVRETPGKYPRGGGKPTNQPLLAK